MAFKNHQCTGPCKGLCKGPCRDLLCFTRTAEKSNSRNTSGTDKDEKRYLTAYCVQCQHRKRISVFYSYYFHEAENKGVCRSCTMRRYMHDDSYTPVSLAPQEPTEPVRTIASSFPVGAWCRSEGTRRCTICRQIKASFEFRITRSAITGTIARCRACLHALSRINRASRDKGKKFTIYTVENAISRANSTMMHHHSFST